MLDRRSLLITGGAAGALFALSPAIAFARAATDRRLLFVLQRGAADGLGTLAPVGDPDFERLRGPWAEQALTGARAGSFFTIHPNLSAVAGMYASGEAAFVHATASSYRERSHFDAQNLIESGGAKPYAVRDGWLNRLVGMLPPEGSRALALAPAIPLALQGTNRTSSYAPSNLPEASAELSERVSALYASDPLLSSLWEEALRTREMAGDTQMRNLRNAQQTGQLAASLMNGAEGARIMMVESNGWDSHAGQPNQIGGALERLDAFLGAFRTALGESWQDTLVVVATEFGRTAKPNGTNGTDHGTAGAAMLMGGTVTGGRVIADWPGLKQNDLYEARDLMPTLALEAVLAGAIAEHFSLDPARAMVTLFPGRSATAKTGLLRT